MWTSTDPAGQFWSGYRYTTNPVNHIDPNGMEEVDDDFVGPLAPWQWYEGASVEHASPAIAYELFYAHDMAAYRRMEFLASTGISDFSDFMSYLSDATIRRASNEDYYFTKIAESSQALPVFVSDYSPDSDWGRLVYDKGNHKWNMRLPGGYHLTEDEGHPGVWVHYDAYDALKGPRANVQHWLREVTPYHSEYRF